VTKPPKVIHDKTGDYQKANFDVEIAVDAMRWQDTYNTLILFSGDSDFDYLLQNLRQAGKRAVVCSTRHHVSRELLAVADMYLDLRRWKEQWGI